MWQYKYVNNNSQSCHRKWCITDTLFAFFPQIIHLSFVCFLHKIHFLVNLKYNRIWSITDALILSFSIKLQALIWSSTLGQTLSYELAHISLLLLHALGWLIQFGDPSLRVIRSKAEPSSFDNVSVLGTGVTGARVIIPPVEMNKMWY